MIECDFCGDLAVYTVFTDSEFVFCIEPTERCQGLFMDHPVNWPVCKRCQSLVFNYDLEKLVNISMKVRKTIGLNEDYEILIQIYTQFLKHAILPSLN